MKRFILLTSLLFSLLLAACADKAVAPMDNGTSVAGVVRDEGGLIVPYAVVEAFDPSNAILAVDTTDESGSFLLPGLPADLNGIRVRFTHDGFHLVEISLPEIVRDAGGRSGLVFGLLHDDTCCATLRVHIVRNSSDTAVSGAEVRLRRGDHLITLAHTNDDGWALFNHVCAGSYNIRVARDGYAVLERGEITVADCDTVTVEGSMTATGAAHEGDTCCNGVLQVVPRDSAGNVISGATVALRHGTTTVRSGVSNGSGITFREICSGDYNVRIAKDGYHVVEFEITVHCSADLSETRTLTAIATHDEDSCCHGRIEFHVSDSTTGAALSGATVRLLQNGTLLHTGTTHDGVVTFDGLCQGEYRVAIGIDGYSGKEFSVTLGCDGSLQVTRALAPIDHHECCGGVLTVTVRDSTHGSALAGAVVKLWSGGTLVSTATTGDNGTVHFYHICQGSYGVSINRNDYNGVEFQETFGCNDTVEVSRMLSATTADHCCTAQIRLHVKVDGTEHDWISGVHVTITRDGTQIAEGSTNADGTFVREQICGPATCTVTLSKDGYHSRTLTIVFEDCRTAEETVALQPI